jgi:hypothetical protein
MCELLVGLAEVNVLGVNEVVDGPVRVQVARPAQLKAHAGPAICAGRG